MGDLKPTKFRVFVKQESNNLNGMVEVISLTSSMAKALALRQFFGKTWNIVKVEKVEK